MNEKLRNAAAMLEEAGRGIVRGEDDIDQIADKQTADCLNGLKNTIDQLAVSVGEIHSYLEQQAETEQPAPSKQTQLSTALECVEAQGKRIRDLVSENNQLLVCLKEITRKAYFPPYPKGSREPDATVHPDLIRGARLLIVAIEESRS